MFWYTRSPKQIVGSCEKDFRTFQEMDLALGKMRITAKIFSGKFSRNPIDG
jgi:hypothetical protein